MHYAACGGWMLERKHFHVVDDALCKIFRQHGFPTALTCGHMPGAEAMTLEWGRIMLVPRLTKIDIVMPNERAVAFHDHRADILISFLSGSAANDVLRNYLSARGVPVIEVKV